MRRYLVLGATEVWDGEHPVPLGGGSRLRALLTALALRANRPVAPDLLVDEVWGAEPPADAPGALQALVGRLRRTLGRTAVRSEPGGYRLDTPPETVDLFAFEAGVHAGEQALSGGDPASAAATLTRALDLWRGPALADLPDRTAAAARPDALRLTAQRLYVEAELALGQAARALPLLRAAVASHPLDEAFRAQLVRALRADGRTADALVAYDEARTVLADVLGADPGPELRALHAELLDSGQRPPPAATPRLPQPPAPAGPPTPAPRKGNLRARLTSFVGREAELRGIAEDLGTARLVTLTGPGGSGKTRLALEAADRAQDRPDGVWLAELAPLDDESAVPHAVLSALGGRDTVVLGTTGPREPMVAEPHGEDPLGRLLETCAHRRLLLVLDNCEHVVGAAARLAAELLTLCPGVTVLATSREPLGVPGEVVRPVEPLPPLPARQLFAERAAAVRTGAAAYDGVADAAAVDEVCRRLDGLPLAIELAAARLRALSPRQIADRLDDRFRLLTGGSRTLLPRQQTLRAVVDWSWDLLDGDERAALGALSVFAGGCTLPAAEAVCGPDALQIVPQLVDKSLLVAEHGPAGGTRYRMLETIHEYAAERLAEDPRRACEAGARHTAYYREVAVATDPRLREADQLHWFEVLEADLDNIRAALHRSVAAGALPDAAATAVAMGWFWWLRNYRDEAAGWLDRVIAMAGDPPDDPDDPLYWPLRDVLMLDFFVKSDTASQEQWYSEEARSAATLLCDAYRAGGPAAARFPGLLWPFTQYVLDPMSSEIHRHVDAVVRNCRAYGGDWEVAAALMFRTHITVDSPGGLGRADADRAELRGLSGRLGDRWIRAQLHGASAEIETLRCRFDEARADFEAALRLGRELGAVSEGAFLLGRMAELAYRRGDFAQAQPLCGQAEEEAERYAVWDARTYIRYVKATLLLRQGDVAAARATAELASGHASDGTPPPVFHVLMRSLGARISAAQGDPGAALAELAGAVATAVELGCTDPVVAAQLDAAAEVVASLGDARTALRLAAAADAVRGPLPRTVPEREADAAVRRAAAVALPDAAVAEELAAGSGMDRESAVALLAAVASGVTGGATDDEG